MGDILFMYYYVIHKTFPIYKLGTSIFLKRMVIEIFLNNKIFAILCSNKFAFVYIHVCTLLVFFKKSHLTLSFGFKYQ